MQAAQQYRAKLRAMQVIDVPAMFPVHAAPYAREACWHQRVEPG